MGAGSRRQCPRDTPGARRRSRRWNGLFEGGISRQNIQNMRLFYLSYPPGQIRQTPSGISETASDSGRPARHCCSSSSIAFGLGAALMIEFTSSASRYSGMRFSRLGAAPSCVLG